MNIQQELELAKTITQQEALEFVKNNCTSVLNDTLKAIGTFKCCDDSGKVLYCGIVVEIFREGYKSAKPGIDKAWFSFNNDLKDANIWTLITYNTMKEDEYVQKF